MSIYMKHRAVGISMLVFFAILFVSASTTRAEIYTDEMGRSVAIPSKPKRIVSLAPSITEILFAVGVGNRTVGVTTFSNSPEAASSKAKVGSFVNVSLETVASLNPDLVIATADGNKKEIVEQLEHISVPVYVINPGSLEELLETIVKIGTVTGNENEAKGVVLELRKRINRVVSLVQNLKRPRVFLQVGINPVVTVGKNTLYNRLVEMAGGVNIYGNVTIRYPRCGVEEIIAAKPDIIIVSTMKRSGDFSRIRNQWMRWKDIPAVENNRVYIIEPDLIDHSSQRIVDGLEELARIIHPDVE